MSILFILVVLLSFLGMEAAAWLAHKYIMHGFLWHIHEDHHRGGYTPFQKNDAFFLIFAIPSWLCIMLGSMNGAPLVVAIGFGILLYGFTYFIVHDVIIHQRFKWFTRSTINLFAPGDGRIKCIISIWGKNMANRLACC